MTPTTIILAGGQSSRLGVDKRRLRLWGSSGPTLLERTVQLAAAHTDGVSAVLHDPQDWPELRARIVLDQPPTIGPLGGLTLGLAASAVPRALVLGSDAPLLRGELVAWLLSQPDDADVVALADAGGRAQPLLAVYRRSCLPVAQQLLARGERRMHALLDALTVTAYPPERWRAVDPRGDALLNLNTPEDLALVRARLVEEAEDDNRKDAKDTKEHEG